MLVPRLVRVARIRAAMAPLLHTAHGHACRTPIRHLASGTAASPASSGPSGSAAAANSTSSADDAASAAVPAGAAAPGPLAGIRVLDLSRILAGPFCTQILGDMGAEVWKIENPVGGDDTRFWGPPFVRAKETPVIHSSKSTANAYVSIGESAYFLAANRNKHSLALNLKTSEGQEIVRQLAAKADVLVENYMPGKLESLGLGYDQLRALNPSLIWASLTGFGKDGPMASQPGYDVMASARGGLMHITGAAEPAKVGVAVTDLSSGLYLHGAILAALFARERHPQKLGQRIDTNLLEVQVAGLANIGQNYHVDPRMVGRRMGTAHESIVPYQAFTCKPDPTEDEAVAASASASATHASVAATGTPGAAAAAAATAATSGTPSFPVDPASTSASTYFICGALNNKQFVALGRAVEFLCAGHPSLDGSFMRSPLYANNALRVRNRAQLIAQLQHVFAHFSASTLLRLMDEHGVPSAPINNLAQVFADPQVRHSGIVRTVPHPAVGDIKLTASPVHYSETPMHIRMPPPMLGQHTQSVLQRVLGSSVEQMQRWEQQGVIGCYDAIR